MNSPNPYMVILREEWERLNKVEEEYRIKLEEYPKGSLIKMKSKGHDYAYISKKVNGKCKMAYVGRIGSAEEKKVKSLFRKKKVIKDILKKNHEDMVKFKKLIKPKALIEIVG